MRNFKTTTGAALGESVKGCRSVGIPLAVLGFLAGLLLSTVQPPPALAQQSTEIGTLAPAPADPTTPDEVTLTSRPAAAMRGQSSWDEGYDSLMNAFATLKGAMGKAGVRVTGAPLATFLETDDQGFKFEAMLPVDAAPGSRPAGLPAEVTFGATPAGRAIRFVHRAPYDDIDSTYEAISAYLDSKGIEVKESFTEEYVQQGANAGDTTLDLNIYVQPK